MKTTTIVRIGRKSTMSATTCFGDTLAEAMAKAADSFAYYRLVADWQDMVVDVETVCAQCQGDGKIPGKRSPKRCPACKGKPLGERSVADVPTMSETSLVKIRDEGRAAVRAWEASRNCA